MGLYEASLFLLKSSVSKLFDSFSAQTKISAASSSCPTAWECRSASSALTSYQVRAQAWPLHRRHPHLPRRPYVLPLHLSLPKRVLQPRGLVLAESRRSGSHRNGQPLHCVRPHEDQPPLVPGAATDRGYNDPQLGQSSRDSLGPSSDTPFCCCKSRST